MVSEHFLIGLISMFIIFAGTLTVSSPAFAPTLTVQSIFLNPSGDNATSLNGTKYILNGTAEEIASQYYRLGEEFDKKAGIKPGDPVNFIFENNTSMTIPYTGEYKNPASDALVETANITIPVGSEGDTICWVSGPKVQRHFVCG
jgi:hypothetical protein